MLLRGKIRSEISKITSEYGNFHSGRVKIMNGFILSFIKYIVICVNKMLVEKQMIGMEFFCCQEKQ